MERIPQIVRERLQAGASAGIHPDADILTAFAERSLSNRERSSVLEHLSRCRDCRDVVALALPEIEPASAVVLAPRRWWSTWPAFRWGFAAAGVVIIAVGVLKYQQHSRLAGRSQMMAKTSQTEPVVTDLPSATPSHSTPPAAPAEAAHSDANKDAPRSSGADRLLAKAQTRAPSGANEFRGSGYRQDVVHGPSMPTQWQQQQQTQSRVLAQAPKIQVPVIREQAGSDGAAASQQTAEVQSGTVAVSPEVQSAGSRPAAAPAPSAPAEEMFDNLPSPRVDKAKAASIKATPVLTAAFSTPRWSITSTGGLQRSFDQGGTWEDVDVNSPPVGQSFVPFAKADLSVVEAQAKQKSADKKTRKAELGNPVFRAVLANGSDVWAGGTNGALYHSIDSGSHWNRIIPSSNGSVLTADVVALQFSDPQHGTITTSTPEVWTTSDGGQTWQKQ